jgi:hypothetical protein
MIKATLRVDEHTENYNIHFQIPDSDSDREICFLLSFRALTMSAILLKRYPQHKPSFRYAYAESLPLHRLCYQNIFLNQHRIISTALRCYNWGELSPNMAQSTASKHFSFTLQGTTDRIPHSQRSSFLRATCDSLPDTNGKKGVRGSFSFRRLPPCFRSLLHGFRILWDY